MAAVIAKSIHQQGCQLGGVHGAEGEGKAGSPNGWGAEEGWGDCRPLSTLSLGGWGQSLVRCQQHGGI